METAQQIPERRQWEAERRELVDEAPLTRALYDCDECGARFFGPKAATEWIDHTTPRCRLKQVQEEVASAVAKRNRFEDAIREPLLNAIEEFGYTAAIEMVALIVQGVGERDRVNADTWQERGVVLHEAAQFGEER